MHFVYILIGGAVGLWVGDTGEELLGMAAGVLLASLLFRLAAYQSQVDRLRKRIDNIEQRHVSAIPVKPQKLESPQPVSLYEPEPPRAPIPPDSEDAEVSAPQPIVHARIPEAPPAPGPASHAMDVAKRWMTTGNVPVKVGVIISFFGVAFLLKYAVENSAIEIPISMRYLGVAAFATILLLLGWRMRTRQPAYALSLQGGGIGVLFLTVFAAFQVHELLPPTLAFGILVLITMAAGALAVVQESRALAILGTTGGFLAPLLVSTGSGNHVALFSYYLILNCAVLGVAWYRAWRELNIIGFVFTFCVGTFWGYEYYVPELFVSTAPFLIAYFLFYTAIAVLFAFRQRPTLRGFVDGTLVFGTPTIAFALQTQLLADSEYGLSISAAVVAAFYAALALWLRSVRERNFDLLTLSFIALSVGFATIAIPLAMDDRWTAIAWALEGTALVWIGVRQSGTLARMTGAALAFASGAAFSSYGWDYGLGPPLLNGNYLGGTLIALSSIASARLFAADSNALAWQRFASVGLLVWGLLWWLGTGTVELADHAGGNIVLHLQLIFFSGSFAAMAFVAKYYKWVALRRATLFFLPFLLLAVLGYLLEHDHFFAGPGAVAWIAAVLAQFWIMYVGGDEENRIATIWHGCGAVFFVALFAYEFYWQVDALVINDVWPASIGLFVLVAGAAKILFFRDKVQWPVRAFFAAYSVAAFVLIFVYLLLLTMVCIDDPGDPSPLPYIPLLNPFDLLSLAGLAAALYAIHVAQTEPVWQHVKSSNAPLWLWGGVAFVLATLAVVRGVHHLADIAWDQRTLMGSIIVQTSLTIFWAALGVAGMLLGTRRSSRGIYILGSVLMLVVIVKLWIIDFQNSETVFGIASFLGVGLMLLVVGYFSPIPPKSASVDS